VGVRAERRRDRNGRHVLPARLGFNRLALVVMISVIGSAAVAVASPAVFANDTRFAMPDPAFDAAAFYQNYLPAVARRDTGYAYWPGQPLEPKPVAGLTQAQTNNAYIIVEVGRQMQLPKRAYVVAVATALQESYLRNLANPAVPASVKLPHDGTDRNYDSIGLFQQRPSMGWGTAAQLMDPAQAAARFYARLRKVGNWPSLSVAGAAQAVQRSAYPGAYAKHVDRAQAIVDALPS
jgi:hypothetical protein